VEDNVREGLVGSLDIVFEDIIFHKMVDYWRLPFRCFGYHEIGHIRAQCSLFSSLCHLPLKVWKRKSILGRMISMDAVLVEGKKVKVNIDPRNILATSSTMGELAKCST
jgi:hypothetical protein